MKFSPLAISRMDILFTDWTERIQVCLLLEFYSVAIHAYLLYSRELYYRLAYLQLYLVFKS